MAEQRGFELPIGFRKYPFEMSAENPLMCRKSPTERNPAKGARIWPYTAFSQWLCLGPDMVVLGHRIKGGQTIDSLCASSSISITVFCAIIRGKARAKGPVLVCRRVGQEFEFEQFLKLESIPPKTL